MTQKPQTAIEGLELLTTQEMSRADAAAIKSGTPGIALMEAAGKAVADEVVRCAPNCEVVLVLCGPGNNGGDGFVAARLLKERGFPVSLALLGVKDALKGDAREMAARWDGDIAPLGPDIVKDADVIVDAIFGAGLTRAVAGVAADTISAVNASGAVTVAVDVPSGVDGTTGEVRGGEVKCAVVKATSTITFFRRKPGHLLLPGRIFCGEVRVAGIGIKQSVLAEISPRTFLNAPALWDASFPRPKMSGHKYSRGHALVVSGGPEATGAARLGARGALRAGAGLVTLAGSEEATAVNAAHSTAVMVASFSNPSGLSKILEDARKNTVLIGPGSSAGETTCAHVMSVLETNAACVLDADALTSFEKKPKELFSAISKRSAPVILTPHEGEFSRLFAAVQSDGSKLVRARAAAKLCGGVVILKGADTVIADSEGCAAINDNAPAWTATAGSGDVLAGFAAGLLAQGMPAFDTACAAVWLHGEAAARFGPGLIAEDLPEMLPAVLRDLAR